MKQTDIPLKKVTLYSSGVAYYEHEGMLDGSSSINLSFTPSQINDVLKSLVVVDSSAKKLVVTYQSEDSLRKILQSLSVDIGNDLDLESILNRQKGAELSIDAQTKIVGKIIGCTKNHVTGLSSLSLFCKDGIRIIPMNEIKSFRFTDENQNKDFDKALNLILSYSKNESKMLGINIEGNAKRNVKLSYIMESPVWKPTYRINMSEKGAEFQAWAIVDNSTDIDWKNVKLTLTTGRPVGFKQDLYPPFYTYRPTLPLKVASVASAETYDSSYEGAFVQEERAYGSSQKLMTKSASPSMLKNEVAMSRADDSFVNVNSTVTTSSPTEDMFYFSPTDLVTLNRQESIMIPLAVHSIPSEKFSVFSNMTLHKSSNPKLCIRIENKTNMKFPAGPVSVLSNGSYEGDAMLDFLPIGEKRIIGFGDDMEVSGTLSKNTSRVIDSVKISKGVMNVSSKRNYETVYNVKNSSAILKNVIIEHPITNGRKLVSEKDVYEKTASLYRFKISVNQNQSKKIVVNETEALQSSYTLSQMGVQDFISYSTNGEFSKNIRKAFEDMADKKSKVEAIRTECNNLTAKRKSLSEEQERARKNLEVVGSTTASGKSFLEKIMKLETEL
ncbi:MAG: DUF4139 domain-containing protein, partial [Treponema sp.]|nr:DUF4139 domain-containing protein [Treponema sp.]